MVGEREALNCIIAPLPPPQASTIMRSNNHLRVLLHQLLLRLFPPFILILLFLQSPFLSVFYFFIILPLFPYALQRNHNLLPTTSNTPNPVLPDARPTPLGPLHLIDPLRFPHPLIHVPVGLQPLQKLCAIPRREIWRFALLVHCCCWSRLLSCRCSGAKIWGLRREDTCTWWEICRSGAGDSRFLCGRIQCGGKGGGGCIICVVVRL